MICPNCNGNTQEIKLEDEAKNIFSVDKCEHCGGFWVEKGCLQRIPRNLQEQIDYPANEAISSITFNINCPICQIPMQKKTHPAMGPREFWQCPDCQGHWFYSGQIYNYIHDGDEKALTQTDLTGKMTKRDRVLVTMTSIAFLAVFGLFAVGFKTGSILKASEATGQVYDKFPWLWFLALVLSILMFAYGLSLVLFKKATIFRALGGVGITGSIILLVYVMKA